MHTDQKITPLFSAGTTACRGVRTETLSGGQSSLAVTLHRFEYVFWWDSQPTTGSTRWVRILYGILVANTRSNRYTCTNYLEFERVDLKTGSGGVGALKYRQLSPNGDNALIISDNNPKLPLIYKAVRPAAVIAFKFDVVATVAPS